MKKRHVLITAILIGLGALILFVSVVLKDIKPTVVVEHGDTGDLTIRLVSNPTNGIWKLKDDQQNILVQKTDDMFDVKMKLSLDDDSIREINTQVTAGSGEKIMLGGTESCKIYLEVPKI